MGGDLRIVREALVTKLPVAPMCATLPDGRKRHYARRRLSVWQCVLCGEIVKT